jgi:hypothetical protein
MGCQGPTMQKREEKRQRQTKGGSGQHQCHPTQQQHLVAARPCANAVFTTPYVAAAAAAAAAAHQA